MCENYNETNCNISGNCSWDSINSKCTILTSIEDDYIANTYDEQALSIISDIHTIQDLQKTLYDKLNKGDIEWDNQNQQSIIDQITQLDVIKGNLYNTMNNLFSTYKNQVGLTTQTVADQKASIDIVEKELLTLQQKLNILGQDTTSKLRLIQINKYYGEKYNDHANFMKNVIIFTVLYIILYLLKNNLLISDKIYSVVKFIIVFIGVIILGRDFYGMIFRNNMNYEEYQFPFSELLGGNVAPTTKKYNNSLNVPSTGDTCNNSPEPYTPQVQITYKDDGTATCQKYCGGQFGAPWNNELPASWNGATCIGTIGDTPEGSVGCNVTFDNISPLPKCVCMATNTGWNQ